MPTGAIRGFKSSVTGQSMVIAIGGTEESDTNRADWAKVVRQDGELPVLYQKVYKTKHMQREAAGDRKRRVSRGSRSRCKLGHQNPDMGCQNGIIATTKCQLS